MTRRCYTNSRHSGFVVIADVQCLISAPPLSSRGHPVCRLAVFPISSELSGCRGSAGSTWHQCSYETVRRWSVKFGLAYARKLRRSHPPADTRWHLDEVFVSINGRIMYLWRAVDCEGEVLDLLVQSRRNKRAALKLMRKLLKAQGFAPTAVVTDKLPSYGAALTYGAALSDLGMNGKHITGGRSNNRAENSHLPVRQREQHPCNASSEPV